MTVPARHPTVKFLSGLGHGAYRVVRRADDTDIGEIRKHIVHYNLARPITTRTWLAWPTSGTRLPTEFNTRAEAAQALLEYFERWEKD